MCKFQYRLFHSRIFFLILGQNKLKMAITLYNYQKDLFPDYIDSRNEHIVNPEEDVKEDVFDGFFTIKEAAKWASEYLKKTVTNANISYFC